MTPHGYTVANTTVKEEQRAKQRNETKRSRDNHHQGLLVRATRGNPSSLGCSVSFVTVQFLRDFTRFELQVCV